MISDIGIRLVLNSTADNDGKMGEKLNGGEYFPLYKMAYLLSHEKNDNFFFISEVQELFLKSRHIVYTKPFCLW